MKSSLKDEEAVTSEVVGQAHVETVALKLFEFADSEDRAARFSRYLYIVLYHTYHMYAEI